MGYVSPVALEGVWKDRAAGAGAQANPRTEIEMLAGAVPELKINVSLNRKRLINPLLRTCNANLPMGGRVRGEFEPLQVRKVRLRRGKPRWLGHCTIYWDFLLRRFLPKVWPFREVNKRYHLVKNRALSECEMFGRLVYCGFEVESSHVDRGVCYFAACKIGLPRSEKHGYGLLIQLPRIGRGGRAIQIYKLRTMHPYAQYLHNFVLEMNGFAESGKLAGDFRLADWGRVLRKLWLDELPQFINLLKGEVKLFGVRAISRTMYEQYPADLKSERILNKPGLIPPYYVDLPKSLPELFASERKYLALHKQNPIKTDFIYFFKALNNILFKGARSE